MLKRWDVGLTLAYGRYFAIFPGYLFIVYCFFNKKLYTSDGIIALYLTNFDRFCGLE